MTEQAGTAATAKVKGPASYFPSIERKYGRPIGDWLAIVKASPLAGHRAKVEWLKTEHGMGHGHATAIVHAAATAAD